MMSKEIRWVALYIVQAQTKMMVDEVFVLSLIDWSIVWVFWIGFVGDWFKRVIEQLEREREREFSDLRTCEIQKKKYLNFIVKFWFFQSGERECKEREIGALLFRLSLQSWLLLCPFPDNSWGGAQMLFFDWCKVPRMPSTLLPYWHPKFSRLTWLKQPNHYMGIHCWNLLFRISTNWISTVLLNYLFTRQLQACTQQYSFLNAKLIFHHLISCHNS